MTAEIAVLNKSAIALAADSTMTLSGTTKRYPGNKLFALSRNHPVGVMFYHNAEFMGIPWETLFKMFRQRIPPAGRPAVEDYAIDFLRYLSESDLSSSEQDSANLLRIADDLLARLYLAVDEERNAEATDGDDTAALRTVLESRLANVPAEESVVFLPHVDCADVIHEHRDGIKEIINRHFQDFVVDQDSRELLFRYLAATLQSSGLSAGHAGLVFAGFGEDELFPSLIEVATDGMIGGALKIVVRQEYDIARDGTRAAIVPFAQSEMVQRFMSGVDSDFINYLELAAYWRFRNLAQTMSGDDPEDETDDRIEALNQFAVALTEDLIGDVRRFCGERFERPILTIITHLPKEEFASMAEALVSLTSLKRRVSPDEESVGGPVDVAVISKGDGFIWSKRKHYFDPRLNPDFFARMTTRTDGGLE